MSSESVSSSEKVLDFDAAIADQYATMPEAVVRSKRVPNQPEVMVKPVTIPYYTKGGRTDWFEELEYNLVEIGKANDTESYFTRSVNKHVTLLLKNGFYLDGRNTSTLQYVYFRLREMERNSNRPFSAVMRQAVQNFVMYSNAFLVVVRDSTRSSGSETRMFGRRLAPMAGIFSADPTCMRAKRNKHGVVTRWRQYAQSEERYFPADNVIHMYLNRKDGFIAGTPWVLPVLDDIRAWRRVEELAEMLISKHAFPLFHYQVGTEQLPAREWDNGESEVQRVKAAVERMPTEGCIVTPERHNITAIGSEGKAIDLVPYLEYWENRVMAGLNLTAVDMGRGDSSSRGTAEQVSKGLVDFCTDIQAIMSDFIDFYLLDAVLEEGGYALNETNRVHIRFPVIDVDQQIKVEKHAEYLFSTNVITENEMRRRMGLHPMTPEMRKETHMQLYDIPLAIIKAVDEPFTAESKQAMTGRTQQASATNKAEGTNKKVRTTLNTAMQKRKNKSENINRPTNQGGKLVAKTKPVRDAIVSLWNRLPESKAMDEFRSILETKLAPVLADKMEEGMADCGKETGRELFVGSNMRRYFMDNCLREKLDFLLGDMDLDSVSIIAMASKISAKKPLLTTMLDSIEAAAYSYGYRYAALLDGYEEVWWIASDEACDTCKQASRRPRPVRKLTFDELVPPHTECMLGLTVVPPGNAEVKADYMSDEDFAWYNTVTTLLDQDVLELDREEYMEMLERLAELSDKKLTAAQRKKLPASVFCGPDRSFPCNDCDHVYAARRLLGRYKGPGDKSKIRACIESKAKKLKCK